MTAQDLKNSILQLAMQGKLVEQRAKEGTAKELLAQIKTEKEQLVKEKKIKKEKPLPEITEEEIPFEIPESWEWVRLNDVCTKLVDGDHNPPRGADICTEYIMASSTNINNDTIIELEKVRYLTKEVFEKENERTKVTKGDIFFTSVGTLGRSCVYKGGYNICFQRSVSVICTLLFNYYLKYLFDSAYFQYKIKREATGTAQKGFYLNQLAVSLIPVPPLAEQKRIVAKIEEILPYIERYDKAYTKLETFNKKFQEDMQKSILQFAMQGKLVEQRPEEGTGEELYLQIQAEKEKLIKAGIIKKGKLLPEISEAEKPFDIPASWKWVKLNSIVTIITDGDHQPPPQTEVGIPFLVISNISQGNLSFINTRNVSQDYYDSLQEARKPQNGDILFTVTGSYGIVVPIKTDKVFCVQRHIAIIKKPFVSVDYLVKSLSAPFSYKQCKEKATGTAQKTVGLETLRNLILPLPPLAEQDRIMAELEKVMPYCHIPAK